MTALGPFPCCCRYLYKVPCCCRYLYKEAKSFYEGSKVLSIFEQEAENSIFLKLKDYISIHLYISHPSCGDYAYYVEEMWVRGISLWKLKHLIHVIHVLKFPLDLKFSSFAISLLTNSFVNMSPFLDFFLLI